jgi:hypothetical protein
MALNGIPGLIALENSGPASTEVHHEDGSETVIVRVESSNGRLSYIDILVADLPMVLAALSAADLHLSTGA